MKIDISFIIPVYNAEDYISQCIESILKLSSQKIEILLIDDGSTDNSLEVCQAYAKQDQRVRLISKVNEGVVATRNLGIKESKGEWISFVDADDYIDTAPYEGVDKKSHHTSCDICIFGYAEVKKGHTKEYLYGKNFRVKGEQISTLEQSVLNKYVLPKVNCMSIWGKLYRREFLIKNELFFKEGLIKEQDVEMNVRAFNLNPEVIYIDQISYYYRVDNEKSVCRKCNPNIMKMQMPALESIKEDIERSGKEVLIPYFNVHVLRGFMVAVILDYGNPQNKAAYKERREKFFRDYNHPMICEGIKKASISTLSLQEKVLAVCVKRKLFFVINLMCRIRG